ncbi:MAG: hypothetical protein MZW92_74450 [Comamonadaceae bacterium]|nr:hypothetical protein [Comamonadaceae bacterium]
MAVIVARDMLYAREAARRAKVLVRELPAILTIDQAMEQQSFIMPPKGITPRPAGRGHCGGAAPPDRAHHLRPAGAVLPGRADRLRHSARGRAADDLRLDPAPRRQPARSGRRAEPEGQ